jgi:hypothetical protein
VRGEYCKWFSPSSIGLLQGTAIEVQKYTNVGVSKIGNNPFLVNRGEQRYIDRNNVVLPLGLSSFPML